MIRRLGPDEFHLLRELRLTALSDAPAAFGSTFEREVAFTDGEWRNRVRPDGNPTFVWDVDGQVQGMVTGLLGDDSTSLQLVGMWVAPLARGGPAAQALVDAIEDLARRLGARSVGLHVVDGNLAARRLYERNGFRLTGRCSTRARDGAVELEMECILGSM